MHAWKTREITSRFGSEIEGFDPGLLADPEVRRALQELFDRRGVLVFRELDISYEQQVDLTLLLSGNESTDARTEAESRGDHWYISNDRPNSAAPFGRLQFHSDMMWSDRPCEVISLYGMDVEQPATPTLFTSAVSAWETLPDSLRPRVDGCSAVHTAGEIRRGNVDDVLISKVEQPRSTVKPLGLTHPRTGETVLYACEQMTQEIVGLSPDESEEVLDEIFAHLYDPANLLNQEWHNHDLVVWDNIALQHARPNVTAEGPRRTLRKVASYTPALSELERPVHATAV